jgi:nucleoside-diphosphate-sugar epimerase
MGFIDVRDVARLHLWAAEYPEEANGQRYLISGGCQTQQAVADILRKHYPDRKIDVGTPGEGYPADFQFRKDVGLNHDATKAIKATGQEYIPFEKVVLDAAKAFEIYL